MRYYVTLEGKELPVDVLPRPAGGFDVVVEGRKVDADCIALGDTLSMIVDGHVVDLTIEGQMPKLGVVANGHRLYLEAESERGRAARAAKSRGSSQGEDTVASPMPGRVMKLLVAVGDEVAAGQALIVVEAMKMENELKSTRAGTVAEIFVSAGAAVEAGAKLVRLG